MKRATLELNNLPAQQTTLFNQYGKWAVGAAVAAVVGVATYAVKASFNK